eukprot:scaffold4027_cov245-Pinguiococcus_pyrenoidosus.AAC.7
MFRLLLPFDRNLIQVFDVFLGILLFLFLLLLLGTFLDQILHHGLHGLPLPCLSLGQHLRRFFCDSLLLRLLLGRLFLLDAHYPRLFPERHQRPVGAIDLGVQQELVKVVRVEVVGEDAHAPGDGRVAFDGLVLEEEGGDLIDARQCQALAPVQQADGDLRVVLGDVLGQQPRPGDGAAEDEEAVADAAGAARVQALAVGNLEHPWLQLILEISRELGGRVGLLRRDLLGLLSRKRHEDARVGILLQLQPLVDGASRGQLGAAVQYSERALVLELLRAVLKGFRQRSVLHSSISFPPLRPLPSPSWTASCSAAVPVTGEDGLQWWFGSRTGLSKSRCRRTLP